MRQLWLSRVDGVGSVSRSPIWQLRYVSRSLLLIISLVSYIWCCPRFSSGSLDIRLDMPSLMFYLKCLDSKLKSVPLWIKASGECSVTLWANCSDPYHSIHSYSLTHSHKTTFTHSLAHWDIKKPQRNMKMCAREDTLMHALIFIHTLFL